jgi:hypothetical protein
LEKLETLSAIEAERDAVPVDLRHLPASAS